ncbi:MAG: hypothetical protein FWF52_05665 [Candidatus Azobacteroides sp.]|nr:hypothetical protein [Candidatus Azobacteroides sp.]
MKKFILCFLVFCLLPVIQAYGDSVNPISASLGAGNPSPRKATLIQVASEKLYIRLGCYNEFTVKYVLWNNSNRDYIDIDYAVPVNYPSGKADYGNTGSDFDNAQSSDTSAWSKNYIKGISFYVNGEEVPFKTSDEELTTGKRESVDKKDFFPNDEILRQYSEKDRQAILKTAQEEYEEALRESKAPVLGRQWFYIRFDIKAYQAINVEVHYALRNLPSKSAYSSFSERKGHACEVKYDFSSAEYWGDSSAWDFSVQIDASELALVPDSFENSSDITLEGLPFSRRGNLYSYAAQNFAFKNAAVLSLNYQLMNNIPLSDWLNKRIPNEEYTITVSSEQMKYPASNLADMDLSTVWIPPINGGVNEKIIIQFKQPTAVSDLVLVNGYHKNEKTYRENSRAKSIEIDAEGLMDRKNKTNKEERNLHLFFDSSPDDSYLPLDFENLKLHPDVSSVLLAYPLDLFKVTKIELVIDDIYLGTKNNDLCIGEIILFRNEEQK